METLYSILQVPTKETLTRHRIIYFDKVVEKYPAIYEQIIGFINDCYNYKSSVIVEEKEWALFLDERFEVNNLPDYIYGDLVQMKCREIVNAIDDFLTAQKEPDFQTLIAKQNLRKDMLAYAQNSENKISDRQTANSLITTLDDEINSIHERLRQATKVFGNHKGFDAVKQAKAVTQLSISQMISNK